MLLGFRHEEFQNFVTYFSVLRQMVRVGIRSGLIGLRLARLSRCSLFGRSAFAGWRGGKRKGVALLECGDVAGGLFAVRADLQQIEFENRNSIRNKFSQR